MARYPYHRLPSEYAFQKLVCDLCRYLLGEGVEEFAKGKDAGRDARFSGTANRYPSDISPLAGKFIIQAKWTEDEAASFAEAAFQRVLKQEEVPKVIKLKDGGELEFWIIASNRRKNAISATKLEKELLEAVGCKSVHLWGADELDGWLKQLPQLIKNYNLEGLLIPFQVDPLELRDVIEVLYAHRQQALAIINSRWDFAGYAGIERKNEINNLCGLRQSFSRTSSVIVLKAAPRCSRKSKTLPAMTRKFGFYLQLIFYFCLVGWTIIRRPTRLNTLLRRERLQNDF